MTCVFSHLLVKAEAKSRSLGGQQKSMSAKDEEAQGGHLPLRADALDISVENLVKHPFFL